MQARHVVNNYYTHWEVKSPTINNSQGNSYPVPMEYGPFCFTEEVQFHKPLFWLNRLRSCIVTYIYSSLILVDHQMKKRVEIDMQVNGRSVIGGQKEIQLAIDDVRDSSITAS